MDRLRRDFDRLASQLDSIEALLDEGDERLGRRAPRVSGWSVAQQIDHMLKVLERAAGLLLTAGEALPKGINTTGRILLGLGRLPRGVAQAPKATRGEETSAEGLRVELQSVREAIGRLRAAAERLADRRPLLPHPYFGGLTPGQAVRFLGIHTDHHLRIVADIRRATGAGG